VKLGFAHAEICVLMRKNKKWKNLFMCIVVVQRYWGFGCKVLMVNDKFVLVDFFLVVF
jgi:hypothetical protein